MDANNNDRIRTNLFGEAYAVLRTKTETFIALIRCRGGSGWDITPNVERAIKDYFHTSDVKIKSGGTLTSENKLLLQIECNQLKRDSTIDCTIHIVVTY